MKKIFFLTLFTFGCFSLFSQAKPIHRYTDEEIAKLSTYIEELEKSDSLAKILEENYQVLQGNYKTLQGNYKTLKDSIVLAKSVKKDTLVSVENKTTENSNLNSGVVYKVQFFSSHEKTPLNSDKFKSIEKLGEYMDDGVYKYTSGEFVNKKDAADLQSKLLTNGFKDSFIVTMQNGKRIAPKTDPKPVETKKSSDKTGKTGTPKKEPAPKKH